MIDDESRLHIHNKNNKNNLNQIKNGNDVCDELFLGILYEKNYNLSEAEKYYIKALKCQKKADQIKAKDSINRLNNWKSQISTFFVNKTIALSNLILTVIYYGILATLLFLLLIFISRKTLFKNKLEIKIEPLEVTSSEKDNYFQFKYYFELALERVKYQSDLRKRIEMDRSESVYPTIRTNRIDEFIENAAKTVSPEYGPIVYKIFSIFNPPAYTINGCINFYNRRYYQYFQYIIVLQPNEGRTVYWEGQTNVSSLGDVMKNIAHEILMSIQR
jgi:hypothetical protein